MEIQRLDKGDDSRLFDSFSIRESAKEIKSSTDFIRDEISKGHIAFYRLGGRIRISREDLSAYLARRRVAAYGERPKTSAKAKNLTGAAA